MELGYYFVEWDVCYLFYRRIRRIRYFGLEGCLLLVFTGGLDLLLC